MNMLKVKLNKKLGKNGGFTLVEMLIVVAIIAILVAVSIPLVSSSLDKAREATDNANMRAAKAEATIIVLNHQIDSANPDLTTGMKYDNVKGEFVKSTDTVAGYNKTGADPDEHWIEVESVGDDGEGSFKLKWST